MMRSIRPSAVLAVVISAAVCSLTLTGARGFVWGKSAFAQVPDGAAGRSGQSEASLAGGMAILAELNASLDAKKSKPGEAVSAHTIDAVKSTDSRTILPKGTKLVGHLTQASARSKGDGESVLGITFDKAVLKDGGEVALNVRVQAVADPVMFSGARSSPSSDTSTLGTTQTSPMGSTRMGPPGSEAPSAGVGGYTTESANSSAELTARSRGVVGLRGLKLAVSLVENKMVGTISSDGKNVRLDTGTRFLLMTIANEAEAPAQ